MIFKISNVRLPIGFDEDTVIRAVKKVADGYRIVNIDKLSLDCRDKNDIHYVASIVVEGRATLRFPVYNSPVTSVGMLVYGELFNVKSPIAMEKRPIIIGSGPSGMFAGLVLSNAGLNPIIFERGDCVENRSIIVTNFVCGFDLDCNTNMQFGEGGAGTFSDGKLNTGISSEYIKMVLNEFVAHGATEDILYLAKPHIGTDILRNVVANIRKTIERQGGEYRFNSKVEEIVIKNGKAVGVKVNGEVIESDNIILACGHSARDTIRKLHSQGVHMTPKAFAVGARIEHSQELIDKGQYGNTKGLPPADYKLSHRLANGRGCFTFCMCPGGYVMPCMSEEDTVVTNGMSAYRRDSGFANSAVLVGVEPEDYGGGVLDGFLYQEKLERLAFDFDKSYAAPAVKVADFVAERQSKDLSNFVTTYSRGLISADFRSVFDKKIVDGMREGIVNFGRKINGFDKNGVLIGVESRSSSPVRIERNELGMSNIAGLYPCGEGAGYAGGIMSSAVDGVKIALKVIKNNLKD